MQPSVASSSATQPAPSTTPPQASRPIVFGSCAYWLGKTAEESKSHEWTVYIRSANSAEVKPPHGCISGFYPLLVDAGTGHAHRNRGSAPPHLYTAALAACTAANALHCRRRTPACTSSASSFSCTPHSTPRRA